MARLMMLLVICALPFASLGTFKRLMNWISPKVQVDKTAFCNRDLLRSLGMEGKDQPDNEKMEMCPDTSFTCCTKQDQIAMYENHISKMERNELESKLLFAQKIYTDFMDASEVIQRLAHELLEKYRYKRISNCQVLARRITEFNTKEVFPRLKVAISEMLKFFKVSYDGVYCAACNAKLQKYFDINNQYNMTVQFTKGFCRDMLSKVLHPIMYLEKYFASYAELLAKFGTLCNKRNKFFDNELDDADFIVPKATRVEVLEHCLANLNHEGRWFTFCKPICNRFNILKFNRYFLPNLNEFKRITILLQEIPEKFKRTSRPKIAAPTATDGQAQSTHVVQIGINSHEKRREDESFFEFRTRLFEMRETEVDRIEEMFKKDVIFHAPEDFGFTWYEANPAYLDRGGINLYKIGQRSNFHMASYLKVLFSEENLEDNKSQFWEPPNDGDDPETQLIKTQARLQSSNGVQGQHSKSDSKKQNQTQNASNGTQGNNNTSGQAQPGKDASRRLQDFVSFTSLPKASFVTLLLMFCFLRVLI